MTLDNLFNIYAEDSLPFDRDTATPMFTATLFVIPWK